MSLQQLVQQLDALTKVQENLLKKDIKLIIEQQSNNTAHIEQTLDYLLDILHWRPVQSEYLKLISYYKTISPKAAEDYLNIAQQEELL